MLLTTVSGIYIHDLEVKSLLTRLAYATGMLTGGAVAAFCLFSARRDNPPLKCIAFVGITTAFFICLSMIPGAVLKGFEVVDGNVVELNGPFRIPFYLTEAILFYYALWYLWKRHKAATFTEEKYQLRLLGAGIFIPAATSIISLAVLPLFIERSPLLQSIGPISTVAFILLCGHAISRQGFFTEMDLALEYMFRSVNAGICVTQADGRIIISNQKLIEMLDYVGELVGRPIKELVDFLESNMQQGGEPLRASFESRKSDSFEITLTGLRNKILDVTTSQLINRHGKAVGVVFLFNDVTEQRMLREEIRSSEEKYRTLVENANDIIYMLDLDGNFMFFNNKTAGRITGHKAEEWIGRNFSELIVPEEREKILQHAREAYKGRPQSYETRIYHKNGNILTLWNFIDSIKRDGEVVGFSVTARDITEMKKLEQQLKESEAKYRTLVEESENIVYIIQDGKLKFVNKTGVALSGYTEEELYAEDFELSTLMHPEDRPTVQYALTDLLQERVGAQRIEARIVSKDGMAHDFIMTGALLTYHERPAIIGFLVDITEKKMLQEQLVQSDKLASIGQLVSGVAHELNNPLTAVMGYAQLFSESGALPKKEREIAGKMFESSERCKYIIQNLLSFARKREIKKVRVDLNQVLDKMIGLREYNLRSNKIEIRRDFQARSNETIGDPQQLQSVFLNLINNACDAMKESNGNGVLKVATRREGEHVIVEFQDNGPGVPVEYRDKLFDPFFTTKEVGKGTGLGLSISYGVVREHGGELLLDKDYKDGARFVVRLPVANEVPEERNEVGPKPDIAQIDSKKKVLVVDDEAAILDLSKDILSGMGFDVYTTCDGENARDCIEADAYDLVIADIRMPGELNGIDLFRWAKQARPGMEDRMVFVTGDIVADEIQNFLEESKRPCLTKPFEISEYLRVVKDTLSNSPRNGS